MNQLIQLGHILYRKVETKALIDKNSARHLEINLGEISREIGCTVNDVQELLTQLQNRGEIKVLKQIGFDKNDYVLKVLENSSIMHME
ncbi:MAG: hypothetical protein K6E93_04645 [Bacteroidales bacterium]|nr:hypothetical protein [Bacteroidales bacterium]